MKKVKEFYALFSMFLLIGLTPGEASAYQNGGYMGGGNSARTWFQGIKNSWVEPFLEFLTYLGYGAAFVVAFTAGMDAWALSKGNSRGDATWGNVGMKVVIAGALAVLGYLVDGAAETMRQASNGG